MESANFGIGGLRRIAVVGNSMSPTYNEGDWLLTSWWPAGLSTSLTRGLMGRAVLVQRAGQSGELDFLQIKRIKEIEPVEFGLPRFWVEGDNSAASTDSRHWGWLEAHEIKGAVMVRYRKGKKKR
ncbi:MAG: S26 family signal peptidase [Actinomycetes bacterium]